MRRSFLLAPIVPVLAFAAVTFAQTREAAAGPTLDLNLNLGTALNQDAAVGTTGTTTRVDFSVGGGLGLGYRFYFPGTLLYLQPELTGSYTRFGFNSQNGYDFAGTVNGGLRFGLRGIVQPNVFGHLGFGYLGSYYGCSTITGLAATCASTTDLGPNLDIGLGLDFRLVPGFTLGAQVAYNTIIVPSPDIQGPDYAAKWFSFGIKAGFQFGEPRHVVYVRRY